MAQSAPADQDQHKSNTTGPRTALTEPGRAARGRPPAARSRVSGETRDSVRQSARPVIKLDFGILVYPPETGGEPWRAVFTENGQRKYRQGATEVVGTGDTRPLHPHHAGHARRPAPAHRQRAADPAAGVTPCGSSPNPSLGAIRADHHPGRPPAGPARSARRRARARFPGMGSSRSRGRRSAGYGPWHLPLSWRERVAPDEFERRLSRPRLTWRTNRGAFDPRGRCRRTRWPPAHHAHGPWSPCPRPRRPIPGPPPAARAPGNLGPRTGG